MQELDYLAKEINQILGNPASTLPTWSSQTERMISDVEIRYLGPIKSEEELRAVQDRLKYLKAYSPRLKGDLKARCDHAIKILEYRISEFKESNLAHLLSSIAKFTAKPIKTDEDLNSATGYLEDLIARRKGLVGSLARAVDEYIDRLKGRISEYRERVVKSSNLGSPDKEETSVEEKIIPDVLKSLSIRVYPPFVAVGKPAPVESYVHTIDSKYAKIEEITPGKEWKVGFEDLDDKYGFTPDYDYDEPELLCTLIDPTHLEISVTKYGTFILNASTCDICYGDKVLMKNIGWTKVGEKATVEVPEVLPTPSPPVTEVTWFDKFKSWLPYLVALTAIGGTIILTAKKSK